MPYTKTTTVDLSAYQLISDMTNYVTTSTFNNTIDYVNSNLLSITDSANQNARSIIRGLDIDWVDGNTISIQIGNTYDSLLTSVLNFTTASFTKKLLNTSYTSGTGNSGNASGSNIATNTWYNVYLIMVNSVIDVCFDTTSSPTHFEAITNYPYYRKIGVVFANATLLNSAYSIERFIISKQGNNIYKYDWKEITIDSTGITSSSYVSKTVKIPPQTTPISTQIWINCRSNTANTVSVMTMSDSSVATSNALSHYAGNVGGNSIVAWMNCTNQAYYVFLFTGSFGATGGFSNFQTLSFIMVL